MFDAISEYTDQKVMVLVLDIDTAMINSQKHNFLIALSKWDKYIFFSNNQKNKRVQLLANPQFLQKLLLVIILLFISSIC